MPTTTFTVTTESDLDSAIQAINAGGAGPIDLTTDRPSDQSAGRRPSGR
jgi:hypothetical protein